MALSAGDAWPPRHVALTVKSTSPLVGFFQSKNLNPAKIALQRKDERLRVVAPTKTRHARADEGGSGSAVTE